MRIENLLRLSKTCLLAAIVAAPLSVPAAYAAAPMVRQSAPGYYRMMLGDFEVTALSDGTITLPINQLLVNTTPAEVDKLLAKSFLKSPLETSVNAYLINTGDKLVLVDAGAAALFGPTLGRLVANLQAAGYQPEQVDEIVITHMHVDHVGGLTAGDKPVFPNATVHADKHEADFWLNQANLDKASGDAKTFFQGAMASLNPYVKAGKLKTFEGTAKIVTGVTALADHGHTPGHSQLVVESKGEKMVLWGDLVHAAAVQFSRPDIAIQYDNDSRQAVAQRKKAFADAARHGYLVAGAHLPFPGIGHLRTEGKGYGWVPFNYTLLMQQAPAK